MADEFSKKSDYIHKCNNLVLCYKTFIGKEPKEVDLEICKLTDEGLRYTIASFDYDKRECCYELNSCGERLAHYDIDWEDFGFLVRLGYKHIEEHRYEVD